MGYLGFKPRYELAIVNKCIQSNQGGCSGDGVDDCLSTAWAFKFGQRIKSLGPRYAAMIAPSSDGKQIVVFEEAAIWQCYWTNPDEWVKV